MTHGNMATDPEVVTGAATETAPETEAPEVVTPEVEAEAEPKAEDEAKADDPAKAIERMQRRIDRKHAAAAKAMAENAMLKQQLEELRGNAEKPPDKSELIKEEISRVADQIAEAKMFARTAETIVESGKKLDPKFMDALQDLSAEVGEFVQPNGLPSQFMRAVLDVSENPTKLLHHLGKNLDLAADLAELPVTKLAARLDRIERDMTATPKQSSAPKPLEPVKPKAPVSTDPSDTDSADEWLRKERARLAAKKG